MKGQKTVSWIRWLRYLSCTGAGRVGVVKSNASVPRQFGSSSSDDAPHIFIADIRKDLSGRRITNRTLSCNAGAVPRSNSILPWASHSLFVHYYPLLLDSNLQSLCSSPPLLHSTVHATSFATFRQGEEGEGEQVADESGPEVEGSWGEVQPNPQEGGCERPEVENSRSRIQPDAQVTNLLSERYSIKDIRSTSEASCTNAEGLQHCHEDDLGSLGVGLQTKVGWTELGWSSKDVWNWPNAISMARLLAGPLLGWMVLHELWSSAVIGLVIAGISDWLDGYVARKMNTNSVVGSYLDPVADKFLVGSLAVSMAYTGLLHPALVGLIVARDGVLIGGAFVHRAYLLHWQWNDWREIFRISSAGKVKPLFISKVNTVLQLALIGVALLQPALSMEDTHSLVSTLSWSVVATTSMSWGAYAYIYYKNPDEVAAVQRGKRLPGPKISQRSTSEPSE